MSLSVRLRIALYSGIALVVASSLLTVVAYRLSDQMSKELVESTLTSRLQDNVNALDMYSERAYGELREVDGVLVDARGEGIVNNSALVDMVLDRTGILSTVFAREGDDFRRVASTINNADGSSVVGTLLDRSSAAYEPNIGGQRYLGNAMVLGEPFLTAYEPVFGERGRVIGILAVAMPVAEAESIVADGLSSLVTGLLTTFAIVAVVSLVIIYFLAGMIIAPVNRASAMLKDIAEGGGDLTQRLAIKRSDEIGGLGHWFDIFVGNIQNIISKVASNSSEVGEQSTSLSQIADRLGSGAGNTAERSTSVAAAAEEMSVTMMSVASTTDSASQNMQAVASASEEMMSAINEIAQNAGAAREITERAVNQVKSATDRVNELGKAALEISSFTETIASIADQTKLLSINATIESASAGEAGRGFAVVANEIKELAQQTASSTDEIRAQTAQIQASTDFTVKEIEDISTVIQQVDEVVLSIAAAIEEQSASAKDIASNVSEASKGISEIAHSTKEATGVAKQTSEDIAEVNSGSREVNEESERITQSVSELMNLTGELKTLVGAFKV